MTTYQFYMLFGLAYFIFYKLTSPVEYLVGVIILFILCVFMEWWQDEN